MKTFFILFILVTSVFAGTNYKTPAFEVKNTPLYCATHSSEKDIFVISKYPVGEIIDGDFVISHCSKNLSTAQKQVTERNKNNEKSKVFWKQTNLYATIFMFVIFVVLSWIGFAAYKESLKTSYREIPAVFGKILSYGSFPLLVSGLLSFNFIYIGLSFLSLIIIQKWVNKDYRLNKYYGYFTDPHK